MKLFGYSGVSNDEQARDVKGRANGTTSGSGKRDHLCVLFGSSIALARSVGAG